MNHAELQRRLDALSAEEVALRYQQARDAGEPLDEQDPLQKHRVELRHRRQARLDAIRAEREELSAPEELPAPNVHAQIELERQVVVIGQSLNGSVPVENHGPQEVALASVTVTTPAGTGPSPTPIDFRVPKPLAAGEVVRVPFTLSFITPNILAEINALIRFADGTQTLAEPASVVVREPA